MVLPLGNHGCDVILLVQIPDGTAIGGSSGLGFTINVTKEVYREKKRSKVVVCRLKDL